MKLTNILSNIIKFLSFGHFEISQKRRFFLVLKILFFVFVLLFKFNFTNYWNSLTYVFFLDILFFYMIIELFSNISRNLIVSLYRKKYKFDKEYFDNFILGIDKLAFVISNFIFLISLFYIFGVDMQSFFTTFALFAVALTLIFKDIITNFIYGLIIMFSNNFKLKEYIKIEDIKGRIINIYFLNILIKTDSGDIVFVPNSKFFQESVFNLSKSSVKKINYEFKLDRKLFSKLEKLEELISEKLVLNFENVIDSEKINLRIITLNHEFAEILIEINVLKYNFKFEEKVLDIVSKTILNFISKNS